MSFMDKENFIIKAFLQGINGDDGAVLGKWCYSKDLFFEGVHFKREWLTYEQIARKALLVNISDAIVMNAVPKYALLGLALPNDITKAQIKALQKGFLQTAREFNITIIGGDTISSDKISISITLISRVRKKPIFRKGLQKGDLLAFTDILSKSPKRAFPRLLARRGYCAVERGLWACKIRFRRCSCPCLRRLAL